MARRIFLYATIAISLMSRPGSRAEAQPHLYRGDVPEKICELTGTGKVAGAVAFNADGSSLIVGYDDGFIVRYDGATGRRTGTFPTRVDNPRAPVHALAFGPDGRAFALATPDLEMGKAGDPLKFASNSDRVSIRDHSGVEVRRFSPMSGRIIAVAFAADGNQVAAMDHTYVIKIWRVADGAGVVTSEVHKANGSPDPSAATRADFSADLRRAVVLNSDIEAKFGETPWNHAVRLWEVGAREPRVIPMPWGGAIGSVVLSRDGSQVLTSEEHQWTFIKDFTSCAHLGVSSPNFPSWVSPDFLRPTFLALSPDKRRLVTGTKPGFVGVLKLDMEKGGIYRCFEGPRGYVRAAAFLPDGVRIASGGWEPMADGKPTAKSPREYEPIMLWDVQVDGM